MKPKHKVTGALGAAFPYTLPILPTFLFLGIAYGVYVTHAGLPFWFPTLMSAVIFGGSLEFVAVSMLTAPFAPLASFGMALLIQARHLFYGISMLDKYKGLGWKKWFLIYWMCDETFSLNYSAEVPDGVDTGWFYWWIALLDYLYWVTGATLGGVIGEMLPFQPEGLEFVMTAMVMVIFLEQWLKEKHHFTALIGLGATLVCRILFGADSFVVPAMLVILLVLTLFEKPLDKAGFAKEAAK